jgi:hypothetical protein
VVVVQEAVQSVFMSLMPLSSPQPRKAACSGLSARAEAENTRRLTHFVPGIDRLTIGGMPAVAVCVPGMQPVTIGCRDFRGLKRRFSWDGNVPVHNAPCRCGLGRRLADAR